MTGRLKTRSAAADSQAEQLRKNLESALRNRRVSRLGNKWTTQVVGAVLILFATSGSPNVVGASDLSLTTADPVSASPPMTPASATAVIPTAPHATKPLSQLSRKALSHRPSAGDPAQFGTEAFPCPPELEDRTRFWLRIFTEFYRHEKVVHDARYPWIIYEVVDVSGLERKAASDRVDQRMEYYRHLLGRLAQKDPSHYTPSEESVARLFADVDEEARFTRAQERLRSQSGVRGNAMEGIRRSGRYLDRIGEILAQHDVPAEVAFLPHLESGFNPVAESKVGALGLWQFTKDTGRRFVRIENDLDERLDPYRATEAAAKYLRNSKEKLGCWPLAVVSYNHGLSGVMRACSQLGTNDIVRVLNEYDGPSFGFASQNFYCEFLAVVEIGSHPERYFGEVELDPAWVVVDFELPHYVRLQSLTEAFRVPRAELGELNPALGSTYLDDSRVLPAGFRINLPERVLEPEIAYASVPMAERWSNEPEPTGYRVATGDTLARIAHQHRVSVAELCSANGISAKRTIHPGQVLVIP